ncbi:antirestriction protein [Mycobacteroides abscessus subsp. abscessus]|nr:antirestriction protein [Mycobacteroides abscessus subsp. abscessus]
MHDKHTHTPQPDNHTETNALPHSETEPTLAPAIYVASLADYNNGKLHGVWIDAAREPEAIYVDINAMLARSSEENAEEFAIHDYDQFGTCRLEEFDSIELVSRIARGIKEHGEAFSAWAELHDSNPERLDDFSDAYLGQHESAQDFAEQMADYLGYTDELAKLPESLQTYIHFDSAALARDMEMGGDIDVVPDPSGGVWIFDNRT